MGVSVIIYPKCKQLNTTRRTTCKNCGVDLRQVNVTVMAMRKVLEHAKDESANISEQLNHLQQQFNSFKSRIAQIEYLFSLYETTGISTEMDLDKAPDITTVSTQASTGEPTSVVW